MRGVIVYYVVSIVHLRNLQLIAEAMPDWAFLVLYQPESPLVLQELKKLPFERMAFRNYQVPADLTSMDPRALIFSVIQLRNAPLNLLKYGLEHGIPTIAIEESNQMVMNKYLMNAHRNFIYPADHILAASEFEKREIIQAGVPEHRVRVTGWPFYSGRVGKVDKPQKLQAKKSLGLDPDRPVAALTLNGIGYADENFDSLKRQLILAGEGLPPEYQFVIKPHPIEKQEIIKSFINGQAPGAVVLDGTMPTKALLESADLLLNRGVSQVVLEALVQELPVVILSTGIRSPFHGSLDRFIAREPEELTEIVKQLETEPDPRKFYAEFRRLHIPFSPREACRLTCKRIDQIAAAGIVDPEPEQQWLELGLYQAFRVSRPQALDSISAHRVSHLPEIRTALRDLILYRSDRNQLEKLKEWAAGSFREQALRSLWIDQLYHEREPIKKGDLNWLCDFPPAMCFTYFFNHLSLWFDLLLRSGAQKEARVLWQRMNDIYGYVPRVKQILREVDLYDRGLSGRMRYKAWRIYEDMRVYLRRFPWLLWLKTKINEVFL
ncbi:MAG: hypothetical protein ACE5GM_10620 [bacterium]